jgi:dephospho-CoA kinase
MLEELGAPAIDFDILARVVVEPEKSAWKDIVDYFGKQVLQDDGFIDRKKLSKIVFADMEKRKKLESFTHPRIHKAFVKQVQSISQKDPNAIIQAVVPLLLELNMQYLFDKTLVIYIPPEQQIERLVARDGISEEEAANILKAQLPIDEKVGYADFVIDNSRSLEETRSQAASLWQKLKTFQKEGKKHDEPG